MEEDYLTPSPDDDDRLTDLKKQIGGLNKVDRIILLLYIEYASLRKVAKELSISLSTVHKRIRKIKEKIGC
jgi:DNA-directed RNA polymerase specialized sigma24 family protein